MNNIVKPFTRHYLVAIALIAIVSIILFAVSCASGARQSTTTTSGTRHASLAPPTLSGAHIESSLRSVSGLPRGIRVNWPRVNDPLAIGYYLYRDTKPIVGAPSANTPLRVNGGTMIAQSPDDPIYFDDTLFPGGNPIVGQIYYYRLTVVNDTNDESDFSNEINFTVTGHSVTSFAPPLGEYGDLVTVMGARFYDYNPAIDFVHFAADGGSVNAPILDWDGDAGVITVEVPEFAITGQIRVIIDGLAALSQDDFFVMSPYILDIDKDHAREGDVVTITGANLGTLQGDGVVTFDGQEASPNIVWANNALAVTVPLIDSTRTTTAITVSKAGRELGTFNLGLEPTITSPSISLTLSETARIEGRHFGDTGMLRVNGAEVTFIGWTHNAVTAIIDDKWTNGDLVVSTTWDSNPIPFTFDSPLFAAFPSGFAGTLIVSGGSTELVADTNANTDSIEFLIDGVSYYTDDTRSNGFKCTINADDFTNERHVVEMRAKRRGRSATSGDEHFFTRVFDGDYNGDNVVDALDFDRLSAYIIQAIIDGNSSAVLYPTLDGNRDGSIDEMDIAIVGYKFGDVRGG